MMNASPPRYVIRQFTRADAEQCLTLFLDTVRRINSRDYAPAQIDAWAAPSIDREAWFRRFDGNFGFIVQTVHKADQEHPILGFADLTASGHLDRLFVSAAHQRQGIATMLINAIESVAVDQGIARIDTRASITAKPFFLARGFNLVKEQTIWFNGAEFNRFVMEKSIHVKRASSAVSTDPTSP